MNNDNRPLISVIVSIYNVETYLPYCLDSIINQTYKNMEIILIKDGSTTSSMRFVKNMLIKMIE